MIKTIHAFFGAMAHLVKQSIKQHKEIQTMGNSDD